jgi:hypothetical protein
MSGCGGRTRALVGADGHAKPMSPSWWLVGGGWDHGPAGITRGVGILAKGDHHPGFRDVVKPVPPVGYPSPPGATIEAIPQYVFDAAASLDAVTSVPGRATRHDIRRAVHELHVAKAVSKGRLDHAVRPGCHLIGRVLMPVDAHSLGVVIDFDR